MQRGQLLMDYQKYQTHYNDISQYIIQQPKQDRRCTDAGCIVMFFIVLAAFFGIGIMEISEFNGMEKTNFGDGQGELYITRNAPIIAAGIGISIIISFLYVFLLKSFPRPMVYFMIVLSMAVIATMFFIGVILGNIGLMIGMGVTFIVYSLLICCLRKKIDTGIALVKVATQFISQKMLVFTTPIVKLALTILIGSFFAYSLNAMFAIIQKKNDKGQDPAKQQGLITLWTLFWLIFTFVFYYMMTYVISFVCANWYYGIQGSKGSFLTAYKRMFTQFGSIVFAAMVIAVVTFARMVVNQKSRQNKNVAVAICLCIVACLLKAIQDLLQVLNHFTVIVMSVTGQSYTEGAKSTMGLLWKQLGLLSITNLICNFLVLWGLIISIGIPCIITYLLINQSDKASQQKGTVIGIVAICSMLVSIVVFQIIVQSVSCIFIYYSIDKDMVERGLINSYRMGQQSYNTINRYSTNPYLLDGDNNGGSGDQYGRMKN